MKLPLAGEWIDPVVAYPRAIDAAVLDDTWQFCVDEYGQRVLAQPGTDTHGALLEYLCARYFEAY